MSTSFRHVTFACLLLVQLAVYHALPTASVPVSLISREGSIQPAVKALQTEIVELKGNNYTAVPLNDQGYHSRSFKLEEPFIYTEEEKVPAILKRVSEPMSEEDSMKKPEDSKTLQEIGFLKRESVGLYLFHKWSPSKNEEGLYDVDIIVEDIGEDKPPFKPIHVWYKEDHSIIARDALFYARGIIEKTLLWYATHEHMLYEDYTVRNIFLRKTALVQMTEVKRDSIEGAVMPIDWGPPSEFTGVVDVANKDNRRSLIRDYSKTLNMGLQNNFNVEKLAYQLWRHNDDLRREDYYWKTYKSEEYPDGVKCRHLLFKTTKPDRYGQQAFYKVVDGVVQDGDEKPIKKYDGYLGYSALLRIGEISPGSEGMMRNLQKMKLELHMEEDREDKVVYILYQDTRGLPEEPKQKKQWVEWESVEYAGRSAAGTVKS